MHSPFDPLDTSTRIRELLCFVDECYLDEIKSIGVRYRELGFRLAHPTRVPQWASVLPKGVFTLGMGSGDYSGAFGSREYDSVDSLDDIRLLLSRKYQNKHPHWSQRKIDRAVESALSSYKKNPEKLGRPSQYEFEEAMMNISFIKEATTLCPMYLILVDYITERARSEERALADKMANSSWRDTIPMRNINDVTAEEIIFTPPWTLILYYQC